MNERIAEEANPPLPFWEKWQPRFKRADSRVVDEGHRVSLFIQFHGGKGITNGAHEFLWKALHSEHDRELQAKVEESNRL